jgi:hypothetical protein
MLVGNGFKPFPTEIDEPHYLLTYSLVIQESQKF